jgi:hypothetical protein
MMKRLLNAGSLAVIFGGATILAHPGTASATYINPWGGGGDLGATYCCDTGTTHCCFLNSGCATKAGVCVRVGAAG